MTHPNAPSTERLREILARPRMSHDAMATNDEIFAVVTELIRFRGALDWITEYVDDLTAMIARRALNGGTSDAE